MKFFGNTKFTRFLEEYHPFVSAFVLVAIWLTKFIEPAYPSAFTDLSYGTTRNRREHYLKGWNDVLFVLFVINVVTVVRYLYRIIVLTPIARKLGMGKGLTLKFVDAGWFSLYYIAATAWGYYIFKDDEWWYSAKDLWAGYPQPFDYHTKFYYLGSLGFWLQCGFSFFFEAPRKDDKAFFFHHLLTIGLILSSYHFNFFRVGAAILMEQNAADIFYYSAKMFKYAGSDNTATGILAIFVVVWVYTRHFIFGWILYSLWAELPLYISTPGWDPVRGYYYSDTLWKLFFIALCALQGLMLYWFFFILRVIYRTVVYGHIADSTDASDSDEEMEAEKEKAKKEAEKANKGEQKVLPSKANGGAKTENANGGGSKSEKKKVK